MGATRVRDGGLEAVFAAVEAAPDSPSDNARKRPVLTKREEDQLAEARARIAELEELA